MADLRILLKICNEILIQLSLIRKLKMCCIGYFSVNERIQGSSWNWSHMYDLGVEKYKSLITKKREVHGTIYGDVREKLLRNIV